MSDQPETLDAIIAEMREYDNTPPPKRAWLDLADRIEAAAARETDAAIREALANVTDYAPGNAAAMREALGKLTDAVREYFGWDDAPAVQDRDDPTAYFCAEMSAALAALAAPARNCDRFATAEEAMREFDAMCEQTPYCRHDECVAGKYRKTSSGGVGCVPGWLFAPAEGGDHV